MPTNKKESSFSRWDLCDYRLFSVPTSCTYKRCFFANSPGVWSILSIWHLPFTSKIKPRICVLDSRLYNRCFMRFVLLSVGLLLRAKALKYLLFPQVNISQPPTFGLLSSFFLPVCPLSEIHFSYPPWCGTSHSLLSGSLLDTVFGLPSIQNSYHLLWCN